MKRLVKVFRVRFEHAETKVSAEYAVIASSEIRALEEVLRIRLGFTSRDTLNDFREQYGFKISAEPWTGPIPTVASLVRAGHP